MARPPQESQRYELSDAEKRDLIALIQAGKPLPEKFRFLLFADKREVELVWNGKTRDVCTAILPFQTLEHIDEPRKEKHEENQLLGFDSRQAKGWTNKLIWGDNKLILSSLKSGALRRQIEEAGGLKLIYIDPPFDVGADFSMDIEIGGETFHKEPNLLEQIAYRDTWGRGADSFIAMIYERLILMRDLLAEDGSLYLHIGPNVNHLVRMVVDEVFGGNYFANEIVWRRSFGHSDSKRYGIIHDLILFYGKSENRIWNEVLQKADSDYIDTFFDQYDEERGERYQRLSLSAGGLSGGGYKYEYKGVTTLWRCPIETLKKHDADGRLHWPKKVGGVPRLKKYESEHEGVPLQDLWTDISKIHNQSSELTGYSTQKPKELLERIIKVSSNPGDLVADFFCGSGTTAAVAEKLGRKWIATDLGKFGIHTTRKRLIQVQRELKSSGQEFRAFEVLNLGRYERQAYLNVGGNLSKKRKEEALARKEREFRELILRAYKAQPLENETFFHGKNAGRLVVVGPINLPVGRLFVEEVITECRKRGATRVDVLAFEFEMGLFPAVLEEAKQKGIDIAPKTIPPEVFDKRAVDKGQVRFADISYVEATPRYDKSHKLSVAIELTDFSVYHSQGLEDSLAAELKEGKSEVICSNGQLVKVSKDKQGVVTKDVLTKQWTDWVDYWAVDFDYESRKEIIKRPITLGLDVNEGGLRPAEGQELEFEEYWTGSYIFENQWQSFRTRKDRNLELTTAVQTYDIPGRYVVAVKVIDIFGNDTMTLVPVNVG